MTEAYRRVTPYLALVGLAAAVTLRVQVAGQAGVRSETAAIWFAVALAAVALVTQQQDVPTGRTARAVGVGLVGAAVLCLPALARHAVIGGGVVPPTDGYARWGGFVVAGGGGGGGLLWGRLSRGGGPPGRGTPGG